MPGTKPRHEKTRQAYDDASGQVGCCGAVSAADPTIVCLLSCGHVGLHECQRQTFRYFWREYPSGLYERADDTLPAA
jgi:hypothetical protein